MPCLRCSSNRVDCKLELRASPSYVWEQRVLTVTCPLSLCRTSWQSEQVSVTVWASGTTLRRQWFGSAWWRWSPSLSSSARPARSPPPPSWRAAASPTSSPPATGGATARSGRPSPKQEKYEGKPFLPVCVCVCSSLSVMITWSRSSLCSDHRAAGGRAAERTEASRSSHRDGGPWNPETEKHGGKVRLSHIWSQDDGWEAHDSYF